MRSPYEYQQTGNEASKYVGRIRPTGYIPSFIDREKIATNQSLSLSVFGIFEDEL